ncbi:MAG: hypothetical protein OXN86_07420 [Chloroflexota bacterium]|nr:hypothetical protein [Chloroflexota bacterium]
MGLRILLLVSMIGLWFVVTPASTYACSCAPPGTPAEALAESELVFRGTVTSIGPSDAVGLLKVDFDVETIWKGPEAETISLTTQQDTAACGYPFEERVEYVVYSWNGVDVARCGRTAPVEFAGEDLAAFAAGAQTGGGIGLPNTGSGGLVEAESPEDRLAAIAVVVVVGAMLVGLLGARLYVRRQDARRRRVRVDRT